MVSCFSNGAFAAPIAGIEAKNIDAENCTGNCHTGISNAMCEEAYGAKTCPEVAAIKAASVLPNSKANTNTTPGAIKDSNGP